MGEILRGEFYLQEYLGISFCKVIKIIFNLELLFTEMLKNLKNW